MAYLISTGTWLEVLVGKVELFDAKGAVKWVRVTRRGLYQKMGSWHTKTHHHRR